MRRVLSYWGYVVVIGSLGMLAVFPVSYAATRLRTRAMWVWTAIFAALDVALVVFILNIPLDAAGSPATGPSFLWFFTMLATVGGACVVLSRVRTATPPPAPKDAVMHCSLLSVDVERSGEAGRDSEAFVQLRRALFQILADAFEFSGISWSACVRHDTGDGMIVIIPAEFPKSRLLYPMLDRLATNLRHHNRYAAEATQIRVRTAIHAGDVRLDEYGITGRPKVLLARLLDADPLRGALAESPRTATVAVIVSDSFHDDVITHGHKGVDPDLYLPVTVRVKETETRAWLYLPGHALPAGYGSPDADGPRLIG